MAASVMLHLMAKQSTIKRNWPKYLLQWGVLAALAAFLLIPGKDPANPEAYCPMGGLQALTTFFVRGSLPCSMSMVQIVMGIVLAAAVVLFSKLFCGYLCPLGTVQDLLMKLRNTIGWRGIVVKNGTVADKVLRVIKYVLLFWIFYSTATASELFCKNLDPYYAVATGFKGEITLWMSLISVAAVILCGFMVNMFWCKYLCPLGAISNSLKFWVWIVVLVAAYYLLGTIGVNVPWWALLAAFCVVGYLLEILCGKPRLQVLHIMKNDSKCTHCGLCTKACPYGIDVAGCRAGAVKAVDCTLCGECTAVCPVDAIHTGVCVKGGRNVWNVLAPAVIALVLMGIGLWAGGKYELPTINVTWGIEQTLEDGTVKQLVDPSSLKTLEMEGLRSVKCYGSSMAFKAKLEKIRGVHGVKTFVSHHRAVITYDPAATTPEIIQESVFTPSKFRVNTPDMATVDSIKVVTIRTENMYDKLDLNYLGLQMRLTDKKIYGLESEFACPLIVRVYMDASETADKAWFKKIVNMKELEMPVHGGGTKITPVNFKFVDLEDGESYISTESFIRKMFTPFKAQFSSRVEEFAGKPQFVYEIPDANYEKPIILRNLPFVSNHLSKNDGIIGVYLELDNSLTPALMIRYAAPMTADRVWELLNMDKWTITYKKDDVREEDAKLKFKNPGVEVPYEGSALEKVLVSE
ncbi:MAG: 4Fe-4S binding protein [Bacteroidales bacterium]|nr:4Fe-4S binding protein [Bacteroidales bacterium]